MTPSPTAVPRSPVRFDDVLKIVVEFIKSRRAALGEEVIIVRDLYGRVRLALPGAPSPEHSALAAELNQRLGAYGPGERQIFLFRDRLHAPEAIFASPDGLPAFPLQGPDEPRVVLLDRQVIGQDWLRGPIPPAATQQARRVTFFGIKGGVGRSTALAVLAKYLAERDKRVLVIDLDLESPGISSSLLPPAPPEVTPTFGVVDWLVEDAVGQADPALLQDMITLSPITTRGEVFVVPAVGQRRERFLDKLSRAYLDLGSKAGPRTFADRLSGLIEALEDEKKPDVVLLDSRAGLHDIAAAATTRLSALNLLFAVNSRVTWDAYRMLLLDWQRHPTLPMLRRNLKMVHALAPATDPDLPGFLESSYNLFQDTIYEEAPPPADEPEQTSDLHREADEDPFSPQLNDTSAPHYPLVINWNRTFQDFEPMKLAKEPEAFAAPLAGSYGEFCAGVADLLFMEGAP